MNALLPNLFDSFGEDDLMRCVTIGECRLEIDSAGVTTVFEDGRRLRAEPESTDGYLATARAHGYGDDVLRLNQEHEAIHSLLAVMLGLPWSPTLRGQVDPADAVPREVQHAEECAVLSVQRWINRLREAGVTVPALAAVERAGG